MQLDISTPALLFPAITLLLLAYTNRFLGLASLIRDLHQRHHQDKEYQPVVKQIKNLRTRLGLIRRMQALGVLSFLLTVACMIALFQKSYVIANYLFGAALVSLLLSLLFSLIEIQISTKALNIELSDMEDKL